jgi:FKBP-type peptidyl-prolyl cis-trans isomerase
MGSRNWIVGLACLVAWGCGPPAEYLPVTPPGVEIPPLRDGNGPNAAEAVGEQRQTPLLKPEGDASNPPTEAAKPAAGTETASTDGEADAGDEALPVCEPTKPGETKTTKSGLRYETLREGTGSMAKPGQRVRVHYTGQLQGGQQIDTSRGVDPFVFVIGAGGPIQGWHEGIAGMRVGELRKLTIPPDLAYGPRGKRPKVPPDATLIFEVELVGLQK